MCRAGGLRYGKPREMHSGPPSTPFTGTITCTVTYPIVWPLWKHSFAAQQTSAGRLLYSENALDAMMAIADLVSRAIEA